jgi:hypothetical protein
MECHDALMARRRKKSKTHQAPPPRKQKPLITEKSLPDLPPNVPHAFSPDQETPPGTFSNSETPTELPGSMPPSRLNSSRGNHRDPSPVASELAAHSKTCQRCLLLY